MSKSKKIIISLIVVFLTAISIFVAVVYFLSDQDEKSKPPTEFIPATGADLSTNDTIGKEEFVEEEFTNTNTSLEAIENETGLLSVIDENISGAVKFTAPEENNFDTLKVIIGLNVEETFEALKTIDPTMNPRFTNISKASLHFKEYRMRSKENVINIYFDNNDNAIAIPYAESFLDEIENYGNNLDVQDFSPYITIYDKGNNRKLLEYYKTEGVLVNLVGANSYIAAHDITINELLSIANDFRPSQGFFTEYDDDGNIIRQRPL